MAHMDTKQQWQNGHCRCWRTTARRSRVACCRARSLPDRIPSHAGAHNPPFTCKKCAGTAETACSMYLAAAAAAGAAGAGWGAVHAPGVSARITNSSRPAAHSIAASIRPCYAPHPRSRVPLVAPAAPHPRASSPHPSHRPCSSAPTWAPARSAAPCRRWPTRLRAARRCRSTSFTPLLATPPTTACLSSTVRRMAALRLPSWVGMVPAHTTRICRHLTPSSALCRPVAAGAGVPAAVGPPARHAVHGRRRLLVWALCATWHMGRQCRRLAAGHAGKVRLRHGGSGPPPKCRCRPADMAAALPAATRYGLCGLDINFEEGLDTPAGAAFPEAMAGLTARLKAWRPTLLVTVAPFDEVWPQYRRLLQVRRGTACGCLSVDCTRGAVHAVALRPARPPSPPAARPSLRPAPCLPPTSMPACSWRAATSIWCCGSCMQSWKSQSAPRSRCGLLRLLRRLSALLPTAAPTCLGARLRLAAVPLIG